MRKVTKKASRGGKKRPRNEEAVSEHAATPVVELRAPFPRPEELEASVARADSITFYDFGG